MKLGQSKMEKQSTADFATVAIVSVKQKRKLSDEMGL